MKVLITGVSGFIGRNLVATLISEQLKIKKKFKSLEIIGIYRDQNKLNQNSGVGDLISLSQLQQIANQTSSCHLKLIQFDLTQLQSNNSLNSLLSNFHSIDCVVHTAGLAHRDLNQNDSEKIYDTTNYRITQKLAKLTIENQIKHFIFLSTSKVFGNGLKEGHSSFSIHCEAHPTDYYASSKLKAEQCLKNLFNHQSASYCTILRLPLVYGAGASANFQRLWNAVLKLPVLPTGLINSKRSMIGVLNLTDLIVHLLNEAPTSNQTLIATDQRTLNLNELLIQIAKVQNKWIYQIKIPPSLIYFLLKLFGQTKMIERLLNNFELKSEYGTIKWKPSFRFSEHFKFSNQSQFANFGQLISQNSHK